MSGHGKKRGGHGGGGGGGGGHGGGDSRWLVTYADLLTVLMVLFLVLWTISTLDLEKFKKFTSGLGDFKNPAAAATTISNTSPLNPDITAAPVSEDTTSVDPGTGPGDTGAGGTGGELTNDQLKQVAEKMIVDLQAKNLPPSATSIRLEDRGLIVSVSTDGVLFDSGNAVLTDKGQQIIAALAPEFNAFQNHIIIEGHTDARPLSGRPGYDNWNLSSDRALSVLKLLVDQFHIPADRMSAAGYGEHKPLDPGTTPEAYARNRRVEIVVVAKAKPAAAATTAAPDTATTAAGDPATSSPDTSPPDSESTSTAEPPSTTAAP
jgi:chemotaxis protein MotB